MQCKRVSDYFVAVREARLKEIRTEIINSEKLKVDINKFERTLAAAV